MIPRFQNILVPVDFTKKTWDALDVVFEMAVINKAAVSLLHVIETIELGDNQPDPELDDFYRRLSERAATELESMGQRFLAAGLKAQGKIRFGRRAQEIVDYCVEHQSDLIVMRSHPLDPSRPTAGVVTLSYQVSLMCPCPILLVK